MPKESLHETFNRLIEAVKETFTDKSSGEIIKGKQDTWHISSILWKPNNPGNPRFFFATTAANLQLPVKDQYAAIVVITDREFEAIKEGNSFLSRSSSSFRFKIATSDDEHSDLFPTFFIFTCKTGLDSSVDCLPIITDILRMAIGK